MLHPLAFVLVLVLVLVLVRVARFGVVGRQGIPLSVGRSRGCGRR
jgi:hypothetical protein